NAAGIKEICFGVVVSRRSNHQEISGLVSFLWVGGSAEVLGWVARYSLSSTSSIGESYRFTASTRSELMSTAITLWFCESRAALDKPTYPRPATAIFMIGILLDRGDIFD